MHPTYLEPLDRHGHYAGQYGDGLRTPSIIHADVEAHAYDDDYTVILADWYHEEYNPLVTSKFLNVNNPTGAEPVPGERAEAIASLGAKSYLLTDLPIRFRLGLYRTHTTKWDSVIPSGF